MHNVKLSIVIPTKNRYEYLLILLKELLTNRSNDFEVIVQDNSENNEAILTFIQEYPDERLVYNYTKEWLSVIDNCELGIDNAKGQYICMLGDDDGILIKKALTIIDNLIELKLNAAIPNKITYTWPDTSHKIWGSSGNFIMPKFNNVNQLLNSKLELQKVLTQGAAFGLGKLPRVYHGFVSINVLRELKEASGGYFPGPSPDMANAIGLTKFIEEYIYIDSPVVISGHGKKSGGGMGQRKEHLGDIKEQLHLPKGTAENWSKKIPFFWSGPTIYAESARLALQRTDQDDKINYKFLYAVCLIYETKYRDKTLSLINHISKVENDSFFRLKINFLAFNIFINRGIKFIENIINKKLLERGVVMAADIKEAIQFIDKHSF